MLVVSACTLPGPDGNNVASVHSPSPSTSVSPSATPTTVFSAAGPGFHGGEVGVAYPAIALTASGGVKPYHWSVASGALPPGMTLGADGTVSGTPTSAGDFAFIMQAADSGDSTATVPGTINVAQRLTASLLPACAGYCRVEIGCSNACGAFGQFSGGVAPYSFTVKQGPLPVGTTLSLNALTLNGTFGGQPGYLRFAVQVGDAFGATATLSPTFWMYPHIAVGSGVCSGNYITGCSVQLPVSGGVPNGQVSVKLVANAANPNQGCWNSTAQPPPTGYTLAVSGGNVIVKIPSNIINGYGAVWTILVTDSALCAPSTYCTSPDATVTIGVQCG